LRAFERDLSLVNSSGEARLETLDVVMAGAGKGEIRVRIAA